MLITQGLNSVFEVNHINQSWSSTTLALSKARLLKEVENQHLGLWFFLVEIIINIERARVYYDCENRIYHLWEPQNKDVSFSGNSCCEIDMK